MMSKRAKSFSLIAACAGAIAIGSAACSGGGGGGSSSPTPTAAATPNVCLIVFETDTDATHGSFYALEFPATSWTNGNVTLTLGSGDPSVDAAFGRMFYNGDFSASPAVYQFLGITTSGSFTLGGISGAPTVGGSFTFSQAAPSLFDHLIPGSPSTIESVVVGSGGNGSVSAGVLMDPTATSITPFDGSVHAHVNFMGVNSNLTLGAATNDATHYAYGFCDAI